MSKIFIFGGSGRVGTDLIKDLVADGEEVTAAARHPENIVDLAEIKKDKLDLHADVDQIAEQIKGNQVIYFTAGSRGKDLIQTDAMGAIKTMMAAEKAGIKRYIMLSSMLSLDVDKWKKIPGLEDYLAAKFFADTYLMDSTNLDYTILQPGNLIEEDPTGKITLSVEPNAKNTIADVAQVLADLRDSPNTIRKVIPMSNGKMPIKKALAEIK